MTDKLEVQGAQDRVVLVKRCESYEREELQRLITEGMDRLGYHPAGRAFVKPNVVFAGDPQIFGSHAYTPPALAGACLRALAARPEVQRIDLGENSAVGFPTRHCLRHAGYYEEVAAVRASVRQPVAIVCLDEDRRVKVEVGGRIHETLRLARTMARADTLVYLPKLKCHCVSRMTGAVKLNVGICSDDDRSIHHDHRLDDKIVDLLAVGWPDFIVMDAVEVGVGNEAFPTPRHLGLLLMGRNPLAVDLVGARLLGLQRDDVPYLRVAVERGYGPASLDEVILDGDLTRLEELDALARRLEPYDEAFYAWQDIDRELVRLGAPWRFVWGPHREGGSSGARCATGCAMGLKMFLASNECYAGAEAFPAARPLVFVVGRAEQPIDAQGREVILIGRCAVGAEVRDASRVIRVDKCFTTASDLTFAIGHRLGLPALMFDPKMVTGLALDTARASAGKLWNMRLFQDLGSVASRRLGRRR